MKRVPIDSKRSWIKKNPFFPSLNRFESLGHPVFPSTKSDLPAANAFAAPTAGTNVMWRSTSRPSNAHRGEQSDRRLERGVHAFTPLPCGKDLWLTTFRAPLECRKVKRCE